MARTLLEKVAAGEPGALEECLDRYGGLVWSLARRFSPTPADAEDAAQEVLTDLWRHAERFDPRLSSEATFVAMIARRRLIDRRRRLARRVSTTDIEEASMVPAVASTQWLELDEEHRKVREQFDNLRAEERTVLELAICQGLTQVQISERTGLPLGTVKTLARQGLIRLRKLVRGVSMPQPGGKR